tara:strand:- start:3017 stop:3226 length:210 start_codon:yes stop_codon:yes gene_type:complete
MTDLKSLSKRPGYPYTGFLEDNTGNKVLFWVESHNKASICNVEPVINVTIEESRITPAPFKCVIKGGAS